MGNYPRPTVTTTRAAVEGLPRAHRRLLGSAGWERAHRCKAKRPVAPRKERFQAARALLREGVIALRVGDRPKHHEALPDALRTGPRFVRCTLDGVTRAVPHGGEHITETPRHRVGLDGLNKPSAEMNDMATKRPHELKHTRRVPTVEGGQDVTEGRVTESLREKHRHRAS